MNVALKTRPPASAAALKHGAGKSNSTSYTFLVHQHLQLILHVLVPLRDVDVQGVVAARLLVGRLLPALEGFQQAVSRLGGHVVD